MKRSAIAAIVAGTAAYVVSYFLQVHAEGSTLRDGVLPGWEALRFALTPLWDPKARDSLLYAVLSVSSALSNLLVPILLLVLTRASSRIRQILCWALLAATALNLQWYAFLLGKDRSGLRAGYFLWVLSFALLAMGLLLQARSGEPRPSAAS